MTSEELGQLFRDQRKRWGIRQAQVADVLGLSVSQVSRLESGERRIPIERMGPWAKALGLTLVIEVLYRDTPVQTWHSDE